MIVSLDCWLKFIMRVLRKLNSGVGSDYFILKLVIVKK